MSAHDRAREKKILANKRRRALQLKRNIFLSIIIVIGTITLSFAFGDLVVNAQDSSNIEYKCYKSVCVESGDTLWSIAEEYNNSKYYDSLNEYIYEVKRINSLVDESITEGNYLIIPYYTSDANI